MSTMTASDNKDLEREIEVLKTATNLSASAALRKDIISSPNIILLCSAGFPDKIIRVVPLPSRKLNLDRGPDMEEWKDIERQVYTRARRDRPIPTPVPVAQSSKDEWSLRLEDIPTVVLIDEAVSSVSAVPVAVAPVAATPIIESTIIVPRVFDVPVETSEKVQVADKPTEEPVFDMPPAREKPPLVACDECGKKYQEGNGMKIHKTTQHKIHLRAKQK